MSLGQQRVAAVLQVHLYYVCFFFLIRSETGWDGTVPEVEFSFFHFVIFIFFYFLHCTSDRRRKERERKIESTKKNDQERCSYSWS